MATLSNKTFLNLIILGGTLEQKLSATYSAGFDEVEIWREDTEPYAQKRDELNSLIKNSRLGVTDIMVLRDFAGAPNYLHKKKRSQALYMMDIMGLLELKCSVTC